MKNNVSEPGRDAMLNDPVKVKFSATVEEEKPKPSEDPNLEKPGDGTEPGNKPGEETMPNPAKEEEAPDTEAKPVEARAALRRPHTLARMATKIIGTPLAISSSKLQTILAVLGWRIGLDGNGDQEDFPVNQLPEQRRTPSRDGVAIVPIVGTLVKRAIGLDTLSGLTAYEDVEASFMDALADPSVKSIVLDVDSPGGEVSGMLDLADVIFQARGAKPIVAVANDIMASAAYTVASAADRVVVSRTSTVGSIGIIAVHVDQSGMDQNLGLKYTTITAGERKNDFDPHAPLTDKARSVLQAEVDRVYSLTVETVARNRGLSEEAVRATEAAIFSGSEAVTSKLADSVGTLSSVLVSAIRDEANEGVRAASAFKVREAMAAATKHAVDVAALCASAGFPELAAEFIKRRADLKAVGKELLTRRAEKQEDPEITSRLVPGASPKGATIDTIETIYQRRKAVRR